MIDRLLTISEAAKYLNISIYTLRRWDKNGKLIAIKSSGGHRYYALSDLDLFKQDIFALATNWVLGTPVEPKQEFYCPTSTEFRSRLSGLQLALGEINTLRDYYPLIVAIAGEIGNNSYDHNLGNWPDISGTFFSFDINKRQIAIADRGQGILRTLRRVRPDIMNDEDALHTAFTEKISGRAPESRGNGLKFVLQVILDRGIQMEFFSGNAVAIVNKDSKSLVIKKTKMYYSGCLALIKY